MTLDEILNAVTIPLEVDALSFRLVPMSARTIAAWNRVTFAEAKAAGDELTLQERLDHAETQREKQLELMAEHMRGCVVEGKKAKVTAEWLGTTVPQTVIQDLAEYFVEGRRPAWAGEPGN